MLMVGTVLDALTLVDLLCFGMQVTLLLASAFKLSNMLVLYQITSMSTRIPSTACWSCYWDTRIQWSG